MDIERWFLIEQESVTMAPLACRLGNQEERRERSSYEGAEVSERQRFSLFSAAVRSSHEKERTRAERTKNWSLMGSLLGTVIGVVGSTYINRVRLQVSVGAAAAASRRLHQSPSLLREDTGSLFLPIPPHASFYPNFCSIVTLCKRERDYFWPSQNGYSFILPLRAVNHQLSVITQP